MRIFFEIYSVPDNMWVKLATMYFSGSADFWLQAADPCILVRPWNEFCAAVCSRFEREQHNQLIRQFYHVKQIGTVIDYVEQFDNLVHQLLAHDSSLKPIMVTNRFIDGLRDDIKAIVLLQRPIDLDTACSLAILQEEVMGDLKKVDSKKVDSLVGKSSSRMSNFASPQSYGAPQYSQSYSRSSTPVVPVEDKRNWESSKSSSSAIHPTDSKMLALMAFRKEKGLCFKCGLKWNPGHKCSSTVPLHVVEDYGN